MDCCAGGLGWFDQWGYLIGGVLLLAVGWIAFSAIRNRRCGIRCVTNFVCAECGESLKEGWKLCPKCGKPVD